MKTSTPYLPPPPLPPPPIKNSSVLHESHGWSQRNKVGACPPVPPRGYATDNETTLTNFTVLACVSWSAYTLERCRIRDAGSTVHTRTTCAMVRSHTSFGRCRNTGLMRLRVTCECWQRADSWRTDNDWIKKNKAKDEQPHNLLYNLLFAKIDRKTEEKWIK